MLLLFNPYRAGGFTRPSASSQVENFCRAQNRWFTRPSASSQVATAHLNTHRWKRLRLVCFRPQKTMNVESSNLDGFCRFRGPSRRSRLKGTPVCACHRAPGTRDFMEGVMRRQLAPVALFFSRHLGGNCTFRQHVEAQGSKRGSSGAFMAGCSIGGSGHGHRANVQKCVSGSS
jgi:hypothetical protein